MKSIITLFVLTTAFAVQAGNLRTFTGKFTLPEDCTLFSGERAYISLLKDKKGKVTGIDVSTYGDEAGIYSIYLGRTVEENPNYKYGNPIKQTINNGYWDGNDLVNTTTYVYGTGKTELVVTVIATVTKKGVVVIEEGSDKVKSCELIRVK